MISRREWIGLSLGAGATLALTPELLRARRAVHRVEDSAAVVEKRLEDLLERGGIRARRVVRERESDDREHLTGRRDGPLNELSALLLKCAEQPRRQRQCRAAADGDSKEIATSDHEAFRLGVTNGVIRVVKRDVKNAVKNAVKKGVRQRGDSFHGTPRSFAP